MTCLFLVLKYIYVLDFRSITYICLHTTRSRTSIHLVIASPNPFVVWVLIIFSRFMSWKASFFSLDDSFCVSILWSSYWTSFWVFGRFFHVAGGLREFVKGPVWYPHSSLPPLNLQPPCKSTIFSFVLGDPTFRLYPQRTLSSTILQRLLSKS